MAEIIDWPHKRKILFRRDELQELSFRRQALAQHADAPEWLLDLMGLYHDWVSDQWAAAMLATKTPQKSDKILSPSGDAEDPNWLAYILGGGEELFNACRMPLKGVVEFIPVTLYLCDPAFDFWRISKVQQLISTIFQSSSWNRYWLDTPARGLLGLGKNNFRWWLTKQDSKVIRPHRESLHAEHDISVQGRFLNLTIDQWLADATAQKLKLDTISNFCLGNLGWQQLWVRQNLKTAKLRRVQCKSASFADVCGQPKVATSRNYLGR